MSSGVWDVTGSLPTTSIMNITDFAAFADGLDHPECVATGPGGELYAGGEAGQVYQIGMDGVVTEIANTGGFHLGLCLDAAYNIYVCDLARHCVQRVTPSGEASVYSSGAPDRQIVTPNYPVFDAAGNLYISDSGSWKGNDGCIFRVSPGGETVVFTNKVTNFPNGLAISPDGAYLYAVESLIPAIVRVALNPDGAAGDPEIVVELPHNVPDGLAFDEAGNLYMSCYTPDVIYRLDPAGELAVLASDWESVTFATPTNVTFCGADRKTMVVASLSRWHLTRGTMPFAGARLNYPTL